MRKNWRAGPPARQPAGRAKKRNLFYHVGPARPGPFNTGQNGPGWLVLTPLLMGQVGQVDNLNLIITPLLKSYSL